MKKPQYIKQHFSQLGYTESSQLLKKWINNSNIQRLRYDAVEYLGEIDEGNHYKFIEQLFLSDENIQISLLAGNILYKNYRYNPSYISLLQYAIDKCDAVEKKISAIEYLKMLDSKDAYNILFKQFKSDIMHFKTKKEIAPFYSRVLNERDSFFSEHIAQYLNLLLFHYYTTQCGYEVSLHENFINTLNCESSGLTNIRLIPAFHKLTHLKKLILNNNEISRIIKSDLNHLEDLRYLDLSNNKIRKMENLNTLQELRILKLSNNYIKEIEGLDDLLTLKELSLASNHICKIENLNTLHQLESLNLSHNEISHVRGLKNLTHLKRLDLSYNNIEDIKGLKQLSELIILILNNNKITNIEGLDNLLELKELFLNNNAINRIQGIKSLKNIIVLLLDNNNIQNFHNEDISNLDNLNFISLNANPLTSQSQLNYFNLTRTC
jgi:hypothetical protein